MALPLSSVVKLEAIPPMSISKVPLEMALPSRSLRDTITSEPLIAKSMLALAMTGTRPGSVASKILINPYAVDG